MIERSNMLERIFMIFVYILLGLLAVLCLYPMLHVFFASISDPMKLMLHTGTLLKPQGFSLQGYKVVLQNKNILKGYTNTFIYLLTGTSLNMMLTILGAYALSRPGYMFKRGISLFIVFTMYFSGGMIPRFLLIKNIGLYDSRLAVILPTAIVTWNLIVMRTSFQGIPASLEESAKLDGANDFTILFRIFLPISKASLAVMILFYAVGHWNSWFDATIFLRSRDKFPLQVFLREILLSNSVSGNINEDVDTFFLDEVIKYATIIVSTVPILFVYPFAQKYFMEGVMLGSIKE